MRALNVGEDYGKIYLATNSQSGSDFLQILLGKLTKFNGESRQLTMKENYRLLEIDSARNSFTIMSIYNACILLGWVKPEETIAEVKEAVAIALADRNIHFV